MMLVSYSHKSFARTEYFNVDVNHCCYLEQMFGDECAISLIAPDVEADKGSVAKLSAEISGGKAPYRVTWLDRYNQEFANETFNDNECTAYVEFVADVSEDITIKVVDSENVTTTAILRLKVRGVDNECATFEDVYIGASHRSNGRYKIDDYAPDKEWYNTFISGPFQFISNCSLTGSCNEGFTCTNLETADFKVNDKDLIFATAANTGYKESANYVTICDSAYMSLICGDKLKKTISGFYVSSSAAACRSVKEGSALAPAFNKGDYLCLTVTDENTGKSIDFYVADYRSDNESDHYCLDSWQWVDLRSLDTYGSKLKFKLSGTQIQNEGATGNSMPALVCIDDFNGTLETYKVPTQTVKSDNAINLTTFLSEPDNGASVEYSIYDISGDNLDGVKCEINGAELRIILPDNKDYADVCIIVKQLSAGIAHYASIPFTVTTGISAIYDFERNGLYYSVITNSDVNEVAVVKGDKPYMGDVIIPQTVRNESIDYYVIEIGDSAFAASEITSVDFGNVREIGDYAFRSCKDIASIDLKNVITVGKRAFNECTGLTSVNLSKVKTIGRNAFTACKNITSMSLNDLSYIDTGTFANCTKLQSVDFCNVQTIGNGAFSGCSALTSLDFKNVKTINSATVSIVGAFSGCKGLTSIDLKNVEFVGDRTFEDCTALTTLDLKNVREIGSFSFSGCECLNYVDLKKVNNLGFKAFFEIDGIKTLRTSSVQPPVIGDECFTSKVFNDAKLIVPKGSASFYKTAEQWRNFVNIEEGDINAIDNADSDKLSVTAEGCVIRVNGFVNGKNIIVYGLDGTKIAEQTYNGHEMIIKVVPDKTYLVKVGNKTVKLVM